MPAWRDSFLPSSSCVVCAAILIRSRIWFKVAHILRFGSSWCYVSTRKHFTVAQHLQPKTCSSISKREFLKKPYRVWRDEIQKWDGVVIIASETCILLFAKSQVFLTRRGKQLHSRGMTYLDSSTPFHKTWKSIPPFLTTAF